MNSVILRATAKTIMALAAILYGTIPADAGGFFNQHRRGCCDKAKRHGACDCAADGFAAAPFAEGYSTGPFGGPAAGPAPWPQPAGAMPGGALPRAPLPAVMPPPGTLGRTYHRPSRPIPTDMHPRVAMLSVHGVADAEVEVADMKGFKGDDGVWHFESESPLLPGNPFIYEVQAKRIRDGMPVDDIRVVRLIPGRIVTLDY